MPESEPWGGAPGRWLVQARLDVTGVDCRPYVVCVTEAGEMEYAPMQCETAATVFVNACLVVCSSAEALPIIARIMAGGCSSAGDLIAKIDTGLRQRNMYASKSDVDKIAVLVPFDGSAELQRLI